MVTGRQVRQVGIEEFFFFFTPKKTKVYIFLVTRWAVHHRVLSRIHTKIKIQIKRLNEGNALHWVQIWRSVRKKETVTLGIVCQECCGNDLNEPYQPGFEYALTRSKQGKQTRSFLIGMVDPRTAGFSSKVPCNRSSI